MTVEWRVSQTEKGRTVCWEAEDRTAAVNFVEDVAKKRGVVRRAEFRTVTPWTVEVQK